MKFGQRLRSRLWRPIVEDEVDAELAFHVEMRAREYEARGMSPQEARETAIRRFGNINRVNATCRALGKQMDHEIRRTEYWSEFRQDVSFACRQLLKNPGFTLVAVITLALGIGATTAIFSAVHSVALRPLPFPQPDRLLAVYEHWRGNPGDVSAGNFVDGIEPVQAFSAKTAIQYSSFNLADDTQVERVTGARATAGFFDVFNLPPLYGRVYTKEEDQPGREQVVVLSHRMWTRRFGGDRSIVGKQIRLSERPYEVIGIMPPAFDYTAQTEELWVPAAFTPERKAMHDEHYLQIYARLKPGVSSDQALSELKQNSERLRVAFPKENPELSFIVIPALADLVGDYSRRLFTLLGAVGFVLLIACGNIANLLLARAASRSGELAIRAALGAGRARIVRQLLTESAVLAIVSAAAGVAMARWGVQALIAAAPPGVPRLEQTSLNLVVLAFALGLACLCAVIFGLAPALRAARTEVQTVLREGGRSAGMSGVRDRLRSGLIAAELAIALVLLVGSGLLIRSSLALQRVNTGFDPNGVLSARVSLPAAAYGDRAKVAATLERIADEAAGIAGAQSAAITSQVPMGTGGNGNGLIPEGVAFDMKNAIPSRLRMVTPEYFETMRIPLVRGRTLNAGDRWGGLKVMVINESLARAAFPGQDAIGKRIACCEPGPDGKSPDYKTVVGVVGDVRWQGPGLPASPEFYLPIAQIPAVAWGWVQRTMYIVVRTELDPSSMESPVRTVVQNAAPGVPIFQVRLMTVRLRDSLATARFNTLLLALLGLIGLVLAAVGIYGVIAYFVTRRTQEIGVRMALGATRSDVVALVVRQAAWPVGIGLLVGVAASALLTRLLSGQLYEVSPVDPATFGTVVLTLAVVALFASVVPARRAAAVDPTRALHAN